MKKQYKKTGSILKELALCCPICTIDTVNQGSNLFKKQPQNTRLLALSIVLSDPGLFLAEDFKWLTLFVSFASPCMFNPYSHPTCGDCYGVANDQVYLKSANSFQVSIIQFVDLNRQKPSSRQDCSTYLTQEVRVQ